MTQEGYEAISKVAAENITLLNRRDSFALIGFTEEDKPHFVKQVCSVLIVNNIIFLPLVKRRLKLMQLCGFGGNSYI